VISYFSSPSYSSCATASLLSAANPNADHRSSATMGGSDAGPQDSKELPAHDPLAALVNAMPTAR
jgi:hypothetical protein